MGVVDVDRAGRLYEHGVARADLTDLERLNTGLALGARVDLRIAAVRGVPASGRSYHRR